MRPVRRADNLTTFMRRLYRNLGASTFWNPQSLSCNGIALAFGCEDMRGDGGESPNIYYLGDGHRRMTSFTLQSLYPMPYGMKLRDSHCRSKCCGEERKCLLLHGIEPLISQSSRQYPSQHTE